MIRNIIISVNRSLFLLMILGVIGSISSLSLSFYAYGQESQQNFTDITSANQSSDIVSVNNSDDTSTSSINSVINSDYIDFHSNIEQMKGHIHQALINKEQGNDSLSIAHTLHPIAEVYSLIAEPLSNANSTLNATLFSELNSLSQGVRTLSVEQFEEQSQKIDDLLNQTIIQVIPNDVRNNNIHTLAVIADLLNIAGDEYEVAVANGTIKEMIEYQDAQAFITRVQSLLNSISANNPNQEMADEVEVISILFSNFTSSVQNKEEPEKVKRTIGLISGEIDEITETSGLDSLGQPSSTMQTQTPIQAISEIRNLLNQSIEAYKGQDYTKAKELAVRAYLDHYEGIEPEIEKRDRQLMTDIEVLLREQMRPSIDQRVAIEQIQDIVNTVNNNLDKAEQLVSQSQ